MKRGVIICGNEEKMRKCGKKWRKVKKKNRETYGKRSK